MEDENTNSNDPPKKPPTAYILWSKAIREQIQKESKGDFASVGRELGKRWKCLSKIEKEPYIQMAAQRQIDYAKAVSFWIFNNPGRKDEITEDTPNKKRKKTQETPNKKKKKEKMVPTGYQLFQREQRPLMRQNNTIKNLNNKEAFGLISKQVSNSWKNLSPKEKEKYNREAAKKIALMEKKEPTKVPNTPSKSIPQHVPPKIDPPVKSLVQNINISKPPIQLSHPQLGSLHHPQMIQHPLLSNPLQNKVYHSTLIEPSFHNEIMNLQASITNSTQSSNLIPQIPQISNNNTLDELK